VGDDEEDKAAARVRFRFYKDRGYEVKTRDMAE
jgi:DNA polymerase-3 subunit chi